MISPVQWLVEGRTCVPVAPGGMTIHVLPLDRQQHIRDVSCWCEPHVRVTEVGNLVVTHRQEQ